MMTPLFYGCNVKILLEKCKYYVEIPLEKCKFSRKFGDVQYNILFSCLFNSKPVNLITG